MYVCMETFLTRLSKGKLDRAKEDYPKQVHSDQMVLGTVRQEAGPRERQPALTTKLAQGRASGLSPLRSDGSQDGQREA